MTEDLRALAERREGLHATHASSRPLSKDYEYVGLSGEDLFAEITGLALDREDRPGGDRGIDFILPLGIDVKTARKPYNLLVEEGKVNAAIYVLAGYADEGAQTMLLGWEIRRTVLAAPVREFGYSIRNHYIPRGELRPMESLLAICRECAPR